LLDLSALPSLSLLADLLLLLLLLLLLMMMMVMVSMAQRKVIIRCYWKLALRHQPRRQPDLHSWSLYLALLRCIQA